MRHSRLPWEAGEEHPESGEHGLPIHSVLSGSLMGKQVMAASLSGLCVRGRSTGTALETMFPPL